MWKHSERLFVLQSSTAAPTKSQTLLPLALPLLLPGRIQVSLWIIVINKSHNPLVLWALCEWSIQHSITNRAHRRALSKVSYWKARPRRFLYVFTAIKCMLAFGAFLPTEMTDFPTLSYTSTSEIATLSNAWSLKNVAPFGRRIPVKVIVGGKPQPPLKDLQMMSNWHTDKSMHITVLSLCKCKLFNNQILQCSWLRKLLLFFFFYIAMK